jgi:hypothetical protein
VKRQDFVSWNAIFWRRLHLWKQNIECLLLMEFEILSLSKENLRRIYVIYKY